MSTIDIRTLSSNRVKISINIPERLLVELDSERNSINQDRSTWISGAILEKLAKIRSTKNKDLD